MSGRLYTQRELRALARLESACKWVGAILGGLTAVGALVALAKAWGLI